MLISMGIDNAVLVRDAISATILAVPIWSALASTMPRIYFWFGQIRIQTLYNMMVPSHAPTPIVSP